MHLFIQNITDGSSLPVLLALTAALLYVLVKGADLLVDEAIALSIQLNVPRVLIGVTIVSLGTTFPEAAVSVTAAAKGKPELALGNAVGSILCNTGLVLGLATLISPLPLTPKLVNRQGIIQVSAGFLLVVSCIPFFSMGAIFVDGGGLSQFMGIVFLILLAAYTVQSLRWVQDTQGYAQFVDSGNLKQKSKTYLIILKLVFASFLVVSGSQMLIPTIMETACRMSLPPSLISATLIAFGTSLPELITSLTAVRKGYGELAVGNVIGADILNVLFVAGAAASVTKGGLVAPVHFFQLLFPAMLLVLMIFRVGIFFSNGTLKREFGVALLSVYFMATFLSFSKIGLLALGTTK